MTDGADLLSMILAEPAEDVHRLKYADWLQEHGDEARAEFIRVQCELAVMDAEAVGPAGPVSRDSPFRRTDARLRFLMGREDALFYNLENNLGSIPKGWNCYRCNPEMAAERSSWDEYPPRTVFFDRGFLHSVKAPAADWLAHANAILTAHPVRRVRLTTRPTLWCNAGGRCGFRWSLAESDGKHSVERFVTPSEAGDDEITEALGELLAAECPGVEFELPP